MNVLPIRAPNLYKQQCTANSVMLHTGYFFSFFIIEVIRNVDHSAHLLYIKGAAAFTVAAVETGIRLDGKLCIFYW